MRYMCKRSKVVPASDLEHVVPLAPLNKTSREDDNAMSPEQAAAVLLATTVN